MTVADRFAGVGLEPEAAQQVFRAVLNSFSRPGLPHRLPSTGFPPALLPALALADLETGVAVLDGADAEWGRDPHGGNGSNRSVGGLRTLRHGVAQRHPPR